MSAATSVSVNPEDENNNRITILEPNFSSIQSTSGGVQYLAVSYAPALYLHLFMSVKVRDNLVDDSDEIADLRPPSEGTYHPVLLRNGFRHIDIVFNGESVAADSVPILKPIAVDSGVAEYQGVISGSGVKYLVFNGQKSVAMPVEAQSGEIIASLVDDAGNELTAEADFAKGEVKALSINNGAVVETIAFGFVKLNFTYQAYRFKLTYKCQDLIGLSRNISQTVIPLYQSAYNDKALENGFFLVQAAIKGVPVVELYELKKDAEFFEFTADTGANFSSELEEQSRIEEERTYEDENGVSSIKMNIVKNVTLKGQDGKEWQLKFKNN